MLKLLSGGRAVLSLGLLAIQVLGNAGVSTATSHQDSHEYENMDAVTATGFEFKFRIDPNGSDHISDFSFRAEHEPYTTNSEIGTAHWDAVSNGKITYGYDCTLSDIQVPYRDKIRVVIESSFTICGNDRKVIDQRFTGTGQAAAPDIAVSFPNTISLGATRNTSFTFRNLTGTNNPTVNISRLSVYCSPHRCRILENGWDGVASGYLCSSGTPGIVPTGGSYTIDLMQIPNSCPYIYVLGTMAYVMPGTDETATTRFLYDHREVADQQVYIGKRKRIGLPDGPKDDIRFEPANGQGLSVLGEDPPATRGFRLSKATWGRIKALYGQE